MLDKITKWTPILEGVSKIVTVFNPAIGGGLMLASEVVEKLNVDTTLSNNDFLKSNVLGLTACGDILADYLQKVELKEEASIENLKLVLTNIRSLNALFDKTVAIMK